MRQSVKKNLAQADLNIKLLVKNQLSKYRSKIEIVADILRISRTGARKTHIIYQGNLSFKLATTYLKEALTAGLLSHDENTGSYSLTEKGNAYLTRFEKYVQGAKRLEKQQARVEDEKTMLEQMCFRTNFPANAEIT